MKKMTGGLAYKTSNEAEYALVSETAKRACFMSKMKEKRIKQYSNVSKEP